MDAKDFNTKNNTETCPHCEGTGIEYIFSNVTSCYESITCKKCNGTGKITNINLELKPQSKTENNFLKEVERINTKMNFIVEKIALIDEKVEKNQKEIINRLIKLSF